MDGVDVGDGGGWGGFEGLSLIMIRSFLRIRMGDCLKSECTGVEEGS